MLLTKASRGFTLLEVLITMIVLAIGMLGLANLQSKIHITEVESYQRAHAVLLLQDMMDRINANRTNAASYAGGGTLGTGAVAVSDCSSLASLAARDNCEWHYALLGASEQAGGANVGAMIGARGCIEQLQAINNNPGVCQPGIYRVTVAWQGLYQTSAPDGSLTCGRNLYLDTTGSINETLRRVVTAQVVIGTPTCSPIP